MSQAKDHLGNLLHLNELQNERVINADTVFHARLSVGLLSAQESTQFSFSDYCLLNIACLLAEHKDFYKEAV